MISSASSELCIPRILLFRTLWHKLYSRQYSVSLFKSVLENARVSIFTGYAVYRPIIQTIIILNNRPNPHMYLGVRMLFPIILYTLQITIFINQTQSGQRACPVYQDVPQPAENSVVHFLASQNHSLASQNQQWDRTLFCRVWSLVMETCAIPHQRLGPPPANQGFHV